MAKPIRVRVDPKTGRIEKWTMVHYMNSWTFTNPFNFSQAYQIDGLLECEVVDLESGAHIRDALVDKRGNVSTWENTSKRPNDRHESKRLKVGWGNIFGENFEVLGIDDNPKYYKHLCSIGSNCAIGAGVTIATEKGFHIGDACQIEDGVTVLGELTMLYDSVLARGTRVAKSGVLFVEPFAVLSEGSQVVGDLTVACGMETGAIHVKRGTTISLAQGS